MYKLGKRFIIRLALLLMVSAVLTACGGGSSGKSYLQGSASMQTTPSLSSFIYVADSYNLLTTTTITYAR
ncbi:MAG: hypothetical protein DLM69_10780 [Candidatus Chloroheliales bacterium]|nr:MAG: hypothetical protein DLM69_10780 [Chloroflexota bacterium]